MMNHHHYKLLESADIVISSTSAQSYIITNEMIERIAENRKQDSLVLIDIAVPRDIEPGIRTITNIFNYDVDDLKGLVDANLRERQLAAATISEQNLKYIMRGLVCWLFQ